MTSIMNENKNDYRKKGEKCGKKLKGQNNKKNKK